MASVQVTSSQGASAAPSPAAVAALERAAAAENFPVASWLLPKAQRAQVVAFYRYARSADDAADDAEATPDTRLARVATLEHELLTGEGSGPGAALHHALCDTDPAATAAALKLLGAFRRDAGGIACTDWADLMDYCDASAAPVGRFLLVIHGEDAATYAPSDALCAALQVLNHLQDMGDDYRDLGRRYLPGDWMAEAGAKDADLTAPALPPALAEVMGRTLDATDDLLRAAAPLPGLIRARGLRGQAAATLALANRLAILLRKGDPLAGRVALRRADFVKAGARGLWAALT